MIILAKIDVLINNEYLLMHIASNSCLTIESISNITQLLHYSSNYISYCIE